MAEAKVELTDKMKGVMESIEKMTVIELADFVKALEEKFGVSAAAPVAVAAAGAGAAGAPAAAAEEKSAFNVVLASAGTNKIQVIKELRTLTSLGLKEAKDLVDGAPKTIKEGATKEEADKIKKTLEAAGAKIELK
jgi:large subunit ribosomal protein L7/L12